MSARRFHRSGSWVLALALALAAACRTAPGAGVDASAADGGHGNGDAGGGGDAATPIRCGFAACPSGLFCMDDPRDACDPAAGGADCPGVCVTCMSPSGSAVSCGATTCNAGEWCDTYFSSAPTCRCGNRAACTGGDHCGAPLAGCGGVCCGVSAGCPK